METITIDGVDEHAFRHSVEDMLRYDNVDEATEKLRALLEPYAGPGGPLPARFLAVTAADVEITGWDRLASRLGSYDRPQFPISAIGVVLSDARVLGGPGPKDGRLAPFIKTYYFSDDAYPFTNAARDDLLDGYSRDGFGWQGDYQATDATLAIKGIDDLHGAIIGLEDRLLDSANPPEDQLRAGTIGACFLAALIHQALRDTIRQQGLPRPLCVLAACDGVYPFFDAPVAGWDDCLTAAAAEAATGEAWPAELEADEAALEGEGSLLSIVSRKGTKHLALELGEDDLREAARLAQDAGAQRLVIGDEALKGLFHGVPMAELVPEEDATASLAEAGEEPQALTQMPVPPTEIELAPEPAPEPEPEPEPFDYYAQARAAFRQQEEAQAFPTGRSLRNRFKEEPVVRESPLAARAKALRRQWRRQARRTRVQLARKLIAGRCKAAAAAEQIGHAGARLNPAPALAALRRAGARWQARLSAMVPRRRR
ncbi:MAG TPA: hypothetical protein VN627_13020 [Novosphingobium sp.]|nr:hypothetical protein [Novosphingobium sp.]